jgi:hypothetical protein
MLLRVKSRTDLAKVARRATKDELTNISEERGEKKNRVFQKKIYNNIPNVFV